MKIMINMIWNLNERKNNTKIPTSKNVESEGEKKEREAKKIDSVLVNSLTFYWTVSLLRRIISDGRLEEEMEINNSNFGRYYFLLNSMNK